MTQADGTSRGQPWVSYALALVLTAGFVSTQVGEAREQRADLDARMYELVLDWRENPFLDLDPRLVELAGGPDEIEAQRAAWLEERRDRGLSIMPASLKRRTQRRFDQRAAETFALVGALPEWRHGVVDRTSPHRTWLAHFAFPDSTAGFLVGLFFTLCLGIALEGVWGPLLFAPFAAIAVAGGGLVYAQLHSALGAPWVGATGLTAALLGAYCVQAIRWPARLLGAFPMPAWLMPILWIGLEVGVVRGVRTPSLETIPAAACGILFALGIGAGLALRALGVEEKLKARDEQAAELVTNPVLDQAMATHEKGHSEEALAMLREELERHPKDRDLGIAFWTVSNAVGRPEEAVPVFAGVVREELRRRRTDEAVAHWQELLPVVGGQPVEAAMAVRLGELLLDAGEPAQALTSLALAVDSDRPMASPLAIRTIRVARDLDPGLTARAAARALADPQLDPGLREEFEGLSADISTGVVAPPDAEGAAAHPNEAPTEPVLDASPSLEAAPAPPAEAEPEPDRDAFDRDGLDANDPHPGALSLDQLSADLSQGLDGEAGAEPDAIERWNDPGRVEDLSAELPDDSPSLDGLESQAAEAYDPTSFGSVDLSPADETTQPDAALPSPSPPEATAPPPRAAAPAPEGAAACGGEAEGAVEIDEDDLDLGGDRQRPMRLLEASPLEVEAGAIKLEIAGRGKTRVPFERIDALSVAAVSGLSARPVVLIDLVMNWISADDEPLKVIRLRSDRLDPRALAPDAASPAEALRTFLADLLEQTGATPLPGTDAVRGQPFAQHADLASYHRDVLMVENVLD
ncbi:MAG: rhomboid family intramembrane serine protease [Myxococcota bacterium]